MNDETIENNVFQTIWKEQEDKRAYRSEWERFLINKGYEQGKSDAIKLIKKCYETAPWDEETIKEIIEILTSQPQSQQPEVLACQGEGETIAGSLPDSKSVLDTSVETTEVEDVGKSSRNPSADTQTPLSSCDDVVEERESLRAKGFEDWNGYNVKDYRNKTKQGAEDVA